jgi:hypothetical protein
VTVITIHDETTSKQPIGQPFAFEVPMSCTLRELIRFRVREEVAKHNATDIGVFAGLVSPDNAAVEDNGRQVTSNRQRIDWERQADVAEKAFKRNGFFVFIDDRQLEDLDEILELDGTANMVFIRLVPLVGG